MSDKHDDFMHLLAQARPPALRPSDKVIEETLLIGLFTLSEAQAAILEACRPGDFTLQHTRDLASELWPRLTAGQYVDLIVLEKALSYDPDNEREAQWASDFLAFAQSVMAQAEADPPSQGKIEAYLSIFTDLARLRMAQKILDAARKELDNGEQSPEGAIGHVLGAIVDLEETQRLVERFRSEAEAWQPYFAALKDRQDPTHDFLGLDTGFSHLNYVTNGLTSGTLIVLGAEPSTGKTTFGKQLADQVAERNPHAACLFVSLEQSREELRVKTLSRLAKVENRDLLRGRLDVYEASWHKVEQASVNYLATIAERVFILEGDRYTTPDRIRLAATHVKRLSECEGLFVVVDYLQIVPAQEPFRDRRDQVDAVVSELKRIARDLGATVLAVSSINRQSYGKKQGEYEAFKESGGVEYGADIAGLMLRDREQNGKAVVEAGSPAYEWQRVNLDIVKNRNGERARVTFDFYPAISLFVQKERGKLPDEDVE